MSPIIILYTYHYEFSYAIHPAFHHSPFSLLPHSEFGRRCGAHTVTMLATQSFCGGEIDHEFRALFIFLFCFVFVLLLLGSQ